ACFAGPDSTETARQSSGQAILGKWYLMFFYPFTILHLLSPSQSPWLYFNLFHYAVGASGVYLAAFRWTGNQHLAIGLGALASLAPFVPDLFYSPSVMGAL